MDCLRADSPTRVAQEQFQIARTAAPTGWRIRRADDSGAGGEVVSNFAIVKTWRYASEYLTIACDAKRQTPDRAARVLEKTHALPGPVLIRCRMIPGSDERTVCRLNFVERKVSRPARIVASAARCKRHREGDEHKQMAAHLCHRECRALVRFNPQPPHFGNQSGPGDPQAGRGAMPPSNHPLSLLQNLKNMVPRGILESLLFLGELFFWLPRK